MTKQQLREAGYDETGKRIGKQVAVGGIAIERPVPKQLVHHPEQSPLERKFADLWQHITKHKLQREYRFDGTRKWRFDFAHPEARVAIEIEGGVWSGGRHTRGLGFISDCQKYNAAQRQGWSVFRLPDELINPEDLFAIATTITERIGEA